MNGLRFIRQSSHCRNALGIARRSTSEPGALFGGVLIEEHRQFYAQLPFILVGTVDATGQPWASMLAAHPGFVHSPDAEHLRFDVTPTDGDPVKDGLALGVPVGVLGIQPSTRRRNRISGRVSMVDERG
jgi:predicted pyridoxine 5'-phosphate oxidase superfamily flavin-nucleotide-binding protein